MKEKVQKAVNEIQRDYYKEVNDWAKEFDDRIAEGEFMDRDEFETAFDQETDGAARVIYTYQARLGLLATDNEEAYLDHGFEIDCSDGIPYSLIMLFAFREDIRERMESDVGDDATFEDEDEDEDDEDDY